MNVNTYCPVQASIDRYCATGEEDWDMDNAIEDRKAELMAALNEKDISDALEDVDNDPELLKHLIAVVKDHWSDAGRVRLHLVDGVIDGLCAAVERRMDKYAAYQIRKEHEDYLHQAEGDAS